MAGKVRAEALQAGGRANWLVGWRRCWGGGPAGAEEAQAGEIEFTPLMLSPVGSSTGAVSLNPRNAHHHPVLNVEQAGSGVK